MLDLPRQLSPIGVAVLTLFYATWSSQSAAEVLNDYILDYQPLTFNPAHLTEKHERVKRNADPYLRWNFRAYGRTFNLRMEPAKSIFAPDHHLIVDDERDNLVDTSHIYEGVLTGDPKSRVHLSIHNDSVLGFISIPGHSNYHIEPASKYIKDAQFPSIIYPESRMNLDPYRHKRAAASQDSSCFSSSLYEKLKSMSEPLEESKRKKRDLNTFEINNPYLKYTSNLNKDSEVYRRKRDLKDNEKTCVMSIRADAILYNKFLKDHSNNADKAKEALLSMFAIHISAINSIYESTTFKLKNSATPLYRGIRFQLQRSTIITACEPTTSWRKEYCTDNLDVSNFLDLTSLKNHDEFCLVHTFTYRDFVGGTLGLAWVASPDSRSSGVCGIFGRVSDNGKITSKSLNTGITTLINFNQEVASRVSQLTFAHEVGHNFGAQHDTTTECAPYGSSRQDAADGNYIMYPSANTGNLPHNDEFSVCSKDYIAKVIEKMGTPGGRVYCFKSSNAAFCGNKIVEKGEECDCGYEDECQDGCCNPRLNTGKTDEMCKRKGTNVCSPSEGPCCSSNCAFLGTGICKSSTQCTEEATCESNSATCPEPAKKPNYTTFCDKFDRVCVEGECIGSVCQAIGWNECFMKEDQVSQQEEMCYVACQKNTSSECLSSFDYEKINETQFSEFKKLLEDIQKGKGDENTDLGVKRPAGSACNYGKGYCDIFSKCRNYDAEGPFRQLTKLIFNPVTFDTVEEWIVDHWWAVLLMGLGVIIFMVVFVKIFGYNTPNEDPKKKNRAQPMPRTNPNADKRSGNNQNRRGGGKNARGVYTTDVPMYDSQPYRGGRDQGHYNQGYQGYQDYNPYQAGASNSRSTHRQYDRIAGTRY